MLDLFYIEPNSLSEWWPRIEKLITDAMTTSRGKYTAQDIFDCAVLKKIQLWVIVDGKFSVRALGITQINDFPSTRICQVICMTGEHYEEWEDLMAKAEHWARCNNCTDMELICRAGWKKVMKKHGYSETHVVLNKAL